LKVSTTKGFEWEEDTKRGKRAALGKGISGVGLSGK